MWKREQVDRGAQVVDVAVQDRLVELVGIAGVPWAQMAGSLAGAVPVSGRSRSCPGEPR